MSPLGRRLLVLILVFSSFVTLLGTAYQLYADFNKDRSELEDGLNQIELVQLGALENSLWTADDEAVALQLEGMHRLPFVEAIKLRTSDGRTRESGSIYSKRLVIRQWRITRMYHGDEVFLGNLEVVASLDRIVDRLKSRVLIILATQALKTFLVSIFVLIMFHLLVTRHINRTVHQIRSFQPGGPPAPLVLERRPRAMAKRDEIDLLVDSYNALTERLGRAYDELEGEVVERTEQLQETSHHLRTLVDHFPGVLWTADQNLNVSTALGRHGHLLGLDGIGVADVPLPDHPLFQANPALLAAHEEALKGIAGHVELQVGDIDLEVMVEPLEMDTLPGTIAVAVDVTERRGLERARHERRMVEAQRVESLGLLAGGIAHDFNNLLTTVLGNAHLLQQHVPRTGEGHSLAENIAVAATRAADLTRQMLAYSGKGQYVVESVDLRDVAREMIDLVSASTGPKVTFDLQSGDEPVPIRGDTTQFRQVVLNLLTNAADAVSQRGGDVVVGVGAVVPDLRLLEDCVLPFRPVQHEMAQLEVRDDGLGMTDATRRRIFDPYFSTKDTGHGLGLSAVLGIVRGHQGTLAVTSSPGEGTTVKVLLPIDDSPPPIARTAPVATLLSSPVPMGTVLVIDDERLVRITTKRMLEHLGYDVLDAAGANEGLDKWRASKPDIMAVVLDVVMPERDGFEVLEELRSEAPELPVLMISGHTEQQLTDLNLSGALGYLQKPFGKDSLRDAMVELTVGASSGA